MLDDMLEPAAARGDEARVAPLERAVSFETTTSGTDESSPASGRKRQTAEISGATASNCQYFELGAQSAKKRRVGENSELCDLYESADWTCGGRRRLSDEKGWVEVPYVDDEAQSKENVCTQKPASP